MNILLTGSTGFIGKNLLTFLKSFSNLKVYCLVRKTCKTAENPIIINDFLSSHDFGTILKNIDIVIHLAAKVHVMNNDVNTSTENYFNVNTKITERLVKESLKYNVKRFIYLSTIKVNGEFSYKDCIFVPEVDKSRQKILNRLTPQNLNQFKIDPYTFSKYKAEQSLIKLCKDSLMEYVIVRPPLVYGPGVQGNFRYMMNWIKSNKPLPFGSIKNLRSLVYIDNLTDFLHSCCIHPNAANQTFLISDGNDISISQLISILSKTIDSNTSLISINPLFVKILFILLNKKGAYQRLCKNLQVSINKNHHLLNWWPSVSVERGLENTAKDWISKYPQSNL